MSLSLFFVVSLFGRKQADSCGGVADGRIKQKERGKTHGRRQQWGDCQWWGRREAGGRGGYEGVNGDTWRLDLGW